MHGCVSAFFSVAMFRA